MTLLHFTLALEALLTVLLVVLIGYCHKIYSNQKEMKALEASLTAKLAQEESLKLDIQATLDKLNLAERRHFVRDAPSLVPEETDLNQTLEAVRKLRQRRAVRG